MARSLFRVLGAPADGEDAAHGCGLGLLLRTEVSTYCLPTYLLRSNRAVLNADWSRFERRWQRGAEKRGDHPF
jgi:hypothetical protein